MTPPSNNQQSAVAEGNSRSDSDFLRIDAITVRFGGITALDNVSFNVARHSVHAIIGPNGAGKSTLFNVLSGLYRADSGTATLDGQVLTDRKPQELPRLGVGRTFQQPGIFRRMTVAENLLLGCHISLRSEYVAAGLRLPRSRAEERRATAEMRQFSELLQVSHVLESRAGEISYGEQKRVEIARTLLMKPTVVLFDEPVAGMNAYETAEMSDLLARLPSEFGVTVVLVEHDMRMVMTLASRVTVLDFGRMIADGLPADVQLDPDVRRAYLGSSYKAHEPSREAR